MNVQNRCLSRPKYFSIANSFEPNQKSFFTIEFGLFRKTGLKGMCLSHFGNGVRNGAISIRNGGFLMVKSHWPMGKNPGLLYMRFAHGPSDSF